MVPVALMTRRRWPRPSAAGGKRHPGRRLRRKTAGPTGRSRWPGAVYPAQPGRHCGRPDETSVPARSVRPAAAINDLHPAADAAAAAVFHPWSDSPLPSYLRACGPARRPSRTRQVIPHRSIYSRMSRAWLRLMARASRKSPKVRRFPVCKDWQAFRAASVRNRLDKTKSFDKKTRLLPLRRRQQQALPCPAPGFPVQGPVHSRCGPASFQ